MYLTCDLPPSSSGCCSSAVTLRLRLQFRMSWPAARRSHCSFLIPQSKIQVVPASSLTTFLFFYHPSFGTFQTLCCLLRLVRPSCPTTVSHFIFSVTPLCSPPPSNAPPPQAPGAAGPPLSRPPPAGFYQLATGSLPALHLHHRLLQHLEGSQDVWEGNGS